MGTESQAAVLGSLVSQPQAPALTRFCCFKASNTIVTFLAEFSSLASCHLHLHHQNPVCLAPLQSLPHLTYLQLVGRSFTRSEGHCFLGLNTLPHVKHLELRHAQIGYAGMPAYQFVSTLETLQAADNCQLIGLQGLGLPACQRLLALKLVGNPVIKGSSDDSVWHTFDERLSAKVRVPANMTSMTQLTELELSLSCNAVSSDLIWIWQLSQLKELILVCTGTLRIDSSLTQLSHLTLLDLAGESSTANTGSVTARWHVEVEWQRMHLHELNLSHCKFSLGRGVTSLVQVRYLKKITFMRCRLSDSVIWSDLLCLAGALARRRPDVCLKLDGRDLSQAIEAAQPSAQK